MAIMHPRHVFHFNSLSEKHFYQALQSQLSNNYEVFYSVAWYGKDENNYRKNSEADFIIVDRDKGFICIEVKGGERYTFDGNSYSVINSDGSCVTKKISAFQQAENSMRYFVEAYEHNYNTPYQGVYGFMAAFPNYQMKSEAGKFFQVPETIIDLDDMDNLEKTIRKAFIYAQGQNHTAPDLFIESSRQKLCDMFNRIYAIEASKGALIEQKEEELKNINCAQDNIINLLSNYKNYAIKGAAGTGKSWIAYKMALKNSLNQHRKTLLISKSALLAEFFIKETAKRHINTPNLTITHYNQLLGTLGIQDAISATTLSEEDQFTTILVDEAQDFDEQEAFFVRSLLREDPAACINIFYDEAQDLRASEEATPSKFLIDLPPYILTENLRNTRNIYDWAKDRTSLGEVSFSNQIDGPEPIATTFSSPRHIAKYLDRQLEHLLLRDKVPADSINIVIDDDIYDAITEQIDPAVAVFKTSAYKGLESDLVFYIHSANNAYEYRYVGLTRARFVLYDIELK